MSPKGISFPACSLHVQYFACERWAQKRQSEQGREREIEREKARERARESERERERKALRFWNYDSFIITTFFKKLCVLHLCILLISCIVPLYYISTCKKEEESPHLIQSLLVLIIKLKNTSNTMLIYKFYHCNKEQHCTYGGTTPAGGLFIISLYYTFWGRYQEVVVFRFLL